jgi:hypothetical protein
MGLGQGTSTTSGWIGPTALAPDLFALSRGNSWDREALSSVWVLEMASLLGYVSEDVTDEPTSTAVEL